MQGTIAVTKGDKVTVHTYIAPESGWQATSHIIELANQLILFDTPLLPEHTDEVIEFAAGLGKPISRVYVSHGHPDHYAGPASSMHRPAPSPRSRRPSTSAPRNLEGCLHAHRSRRP
ncbi:MAG: hypothetical protein ACRDGH_16940 [Candidatus Limnocylindria bacterium]